MSAVRGAEQIHNTNPFMRDYTATYSRVSLFITMCACLTRWPARSFLSAAEMQAGHLSLQQGVGFCIDVSGWARSLPIRPASKPSGRFLDCASHAMRRISAFVLKIMLAWSHYCSLSTSLLLGHSKSSSRHLPEESSAGGLGAICGFLRWSLPQIGATRCRRYPQ